MSEASRITEISDTVLDGELAIIFVDNDDGYIEVPIFPSEDDATPNDEGEIEPVHVLMMTPDEARTFGEILIHAADHGECQQRRN